ERGRAACIEAAAAARALGDGVLTARAALTLGAELMLAQTDTQLVSLLKEALDALPPGPGGLRAQCLARLAAALQPAYRPSEPMEMARQAVAMARAVGGGDDVLRAVLSHAGSALADFAEPAERAALSEELARLSTAAGDRVQALRGQARLAFDYVEMGALDRAARAVDAYERLANDLRQPRHLWPERLMRAMLALGAGRFDEAARLRDEALARAGGSPDVVAMFTFASHSWGRALVTETPDDMMRAEDDLIRTERESAAQFGREEFGHNPADVWSLMRTALHARAGDREAARRSLAAVPPDSHFLVNDPPATICLAETVLLLDDKELGAVLFDRLRPLSGRIGTLGRTGMVCIGAVDGALALYAHVLGRGAEADSYFDRALVLEQKAGLSATLLHTRRWRERLRSQTATAVAPASAPPATAPGREPVFSLAREGEYWTVSAGEGLCRLKSTRGFEMLAELVSNPGREFHVLALMGTGGGGGGGDDGAPDGGDAGEVLDREAVDEYRARLAELNEEIAEAEAWSDSGRLGRARDEREALARELARGVGLGGRARRAGAAAERARTNVQRRIKGAIRKIGESLPALGAYLERAVRTGTFCSYDPLP
ncbi:MAG TPA: hypothetical protein VMU50_07810, partial [Polyangia bacterium]|nr:hypothetical protein [Polyangia bacterium]